MGTKSSIATGKDVVAFLKSQHEQIAGMFEKVFSATGKARTEAFFELRRLMAVHETAEEEIVHPVAARALRHHDHAFRGTHALDHDSEISPAVRVAVAIGTLHVNDGYIRDDCPHRPQSFLRFEWGEYLVEEMIPPGDVAAQRSSSRKKWDTHRARL